MRLAEAFRRTKSDSDLWIVLDEDDECRHLYEANAKHLNYKCLVVANSTGGMAYPLNAAILVLLKDSSCRYEYFGFMGDDHLPKTVFWDYRLRYSIPFGSSGIAYGNDLLQGEYLPTACLMTRSIVEVLGGMVPTGMKHLYLDNFWKTLGQDINGLYYNGKVILEHMHPSNQKAEMDEHYARVNDQQVYDHDKERLEAFIASNQYREAIRQLS